MSASTFTWTAILWLELSICADLYMDSILISFQPHGYYLPTSWIEDVGEAFAITDIHEAHTNTTRTFAFGWNREMTNLTWHIDIAAVTYLRKYVETGISLTPCGAFGSCDAWNMEMPNGFYSVAIGIGQPPYDPDPDAPIIEQNFHYKSVIMSENEQILESAFNPLNASHRPSQWLAVNRKIIEVTDGNMTIRQAPGSFNTSLDYVKIIRIKCKDIGSTFRLPPNAKTATANYSIYYPSTVQIVCDEGYVADPMNAECDLKGNWAWKTAEEGEEAKQEMQCTLVDCGPIDQSWLALYDAFVYWQEYSYYNATAIVYCTSKDVQHIGLLRCQSSGLWQWTTGRMEFWCPSFQLQRNKVIGALRMYSDWLIAALLIGGSCLVFVCMNLHAHFTAKYSYPKEIQEE